jgi:hypothetical protein
MPSLLHALHGWFYPIDCQSIHIICPDDASYITLVVSLLLPMYFKSPSFLPIIS